MKALKVKEGSYWIGDPSTVNLSRDEALLSFEVENGSHPIIDLSEGEEHVEDLEVSTGLICLFQRDQIDQDNSTGFYEGLPIYFCDTTSIGRSNSGSIRTSDPERKILFEISESVDCS